MLIIHAYNTHVRGFDYTAWCEEAEARTDEHGPPPRDQLNCEKRVWSYNRHFPVRAHVPLLQVILQTSQRNSRCMREDVPHSRQHGCHRAHAE
jgi:hypothetical protein